MGNNNLGWIVALVVVFFFLSKPQAVEENIPDNTGGTINLINAIDSSASFTGKDKYIEGTALTSESVRAFKVDGGSIEQDLGAISLNSGTLNTAPDADYKLHYFMNMTSPSTSYYVVTENYKAPVQDAVDNKVGLGCAIDKALIFTSKDANGQTQSATANAQAIAAGDSIVTSIRIAVHSDKCFGTPGATKQNAVCFAYNTSIFGRVETTTGITSTPYMVANNLSIRGKGISCYNLALLEDRGEVDLSVNLVANGEPTTAHNITVFSDDIGFDLHATSLDEIWGFEDESNNQLGAPYQTLGRIYTS